MTTIPTAMTTTPTTPTTPTSTSTSTSTSATGTTRRRSSASRRSTPLTIAMLAVLAYFLLPLFWLFVASTKSTEDLFTTFGLWFSHSPQLLTNIRQTLTQDGGVFLHWVLNTVLYAGVSALGAALLAARPGTDSPSTGSAATTRPSTWCSAPS